MHYNNPKRGEVGYDVSSQPDVHFPLLLFLCFSALPCSYHIPYSVEGAPAVVAASLDSVLINLLTTERHK